jgi:hypothetical protein
MGFTNVPELRKMIVHTLRKIRNEKPTPKQEDISYYRERVNPDYFKKKLERIAEKHISPYAKFEDITDKTKGVWNEAKS